MLGGVSSFGSGPRGTGAGPSSGDDPGDESQVVSCQVGVAHSVGGWTGKQKLDFVCVLKSLHKEGELLE